MKTPKRLLTLLACTLLTAACATSEKVPVAVSCPPPPPVPAILAAPVSTEPPLIEDWKLLMESYKAALRKSFSEATRP